VYAAAAAGQNQGWRGGGAGVWDVYGHSDGGGGDVFFIYTEEEGGGGWVRRVFAEWAGRDVWGGIGEKIVAAY